LPADAPPRHFLARRWRGEVSFRRLFWFDMLAVATVLNLFASFGALMLAAFGAHPATVLALHFAPMPYNVFLFLALWRLPGRPAEAAAVGAVWLLAMVVL
jgi:hypothetical protein